MDYQLYSYDEVCEIIKEKGLIMTTGRDEDNNKICQFGDHGSILNVNTLLDNRYQIHATEKDYNSIKRMAESDGLAIVLRENSKEEVEDAIAGYEEVGSKAILFVKNGNRVLKLNETDKNLYHEIIFFTNENLDVILDTLCDNENYKPSKKVVKHVYVAPKPVEPEMSDDEIKEILPEGSKVTHAKFGQGIIKEVASGKVKVEFADSMEKIFAAKICIKNKLLKVI
ncbi:MAG: hypothetical protein K6G87_03010 [Butyrivibrio sp.]|uniref:hypothetical protein n=1 Tax=Butyrivibrio sp. TaxID=28121 RepID=UPI0025F6494C|nr:hypothetical protein [Butyrivibrio sp.]MCR5770188.1 hypothetical protein [Butyrivibrio sp.]